MDVKDPMISINTSPIVSPRDNSKYQSTQRDINLDKSLNMDINALKHPKT